MRKKFLPIGQIVGTHGVKGMVRVQVWADDIDFVRNFTTFYTDEKGDDFLVAQKIGSAGKMCIIFFKGIDTIPKAEALRDTVIYVKRECFDLPEGRYFINEIIGSDCYDNNTGEKLGMLSDVSQTGANDVWHISKGDKEYLLPAIEQVIVNVDIDTGKILLNPLKGIFDEN